MRRQLLCLMAVGLLSAGPLLAAPPPPPKRVLPKGLVTLDQPPDLPYLAPFPGAVYQSILSRPNDSGGPGFSLTFHTTASSDAVQNFYKDVFRRNNWVLIDGATARAMTGMRKNTVCNVTCMTPYKKGFNTQVLVGYKIFQPESKE